MHHLHNQSMDQLLQAICRLETIEDGYALFEDLCTIKERQDMAQRFDTAILLDVKSIYGNYDIRFYFVAYATDYLSRFHTRYAKNTGCNGTQ